MGRLAGGLKRTSSSLGTALADLVTKRPLDPAMLDEIEDALIRADLGHRGGRPRHRGDQPGPLSKDNPTADEVKAVIAAEVAKILEPVAKPLVVGGAKPFVILVVGVNGSGKTTTDRQARLQASPPRAARWCSPPATRSAPPRSIS